MSVHEDKTQENKSRSFANNTNRLESSSESTFQFVDNRPEVVAQRKLQEMAKNSPQVSQLRAFQEMANGTQKINQLKIPNDHPENTLQLVASPVIQRSVDSAAEELFEGGIIEVKPKLLKGKFGKRHEITKSDLKAIQARLNELRDEAPKDVGEKEEKEQEIDILGAEDLDINEAQLESIRYKPKQGYLTEYCIMSFKYII